MARVVARRRLTIRDADDCAADADGWRVKAGERDMGRHLGAALRELEGLL